MPERELRLPTRIIEPLRDFAAVGDAEVGALARALEAPYIGSRSAFISHLARQLGKPTPEIERTVDMLLSIEILRQSRRWSPAEVATAVVSAPESPIESDEAQAVVADRIERLISKSTMQLAAETGASSVAAGRIMVDAEIFTDVRTLFLEDSDRPAAALLMHVLELQYFQAPSPSARSMYITLDDEDLDTLAEAVDSARRKAAGVRSLFADFDLPIAPPVNEGGA